VQLRVFNKTETELRGRVCIAGQRCRRVVVVVDRAAGTAPEAALEESAPRLGL
jgi:uncharacterized protein (DUF433 family)